MKPRREHVELVELVDCRLKKYGLFSIFRGLETHTRSFSCTAGHLALRAFQCSRALRNFIRRFCAALLIALRTHALFGLTPFINTNTRAVKITQSTSLCAHFNAPGLYRTLSAASPARFRTATFMAFSLVFLVSALHALPGFFTFGKASQPLVLKNYHPTEVRYIYIYACI